MDREPAMMEYPVQEAVSVTRASVEVVASNALQGTSGPTAALAQGALRTHVMAMGFALTAKPAPVSVHVRPHMSARTVRF